MTYRNKLKLKLHPYIFTYTRSTIHNLNSVNLANSCPTNCTCYPALTCQSPVSTGKCVATVVEDVGVMPRAFCGAELQKGAQFGLQGVQA